MKRIKLNLAAMAVILGVGSAFAFTPKQASVRWTQVSDGSWEQVEGEYLCDPASTICTRLYPENHDPNDNEAGFEEEELGVIMQ